MRFTAGILGQKPSLGTRVNDLEQGEREVAGDFESEHRGVPSPPRPPDPPRAPHLVSSEQPPRVPSKSQFPHLQKLARHIWRGDSARSFAAVVRSEPTPIVFITMNRGSGR